MVAVTLLLVPVPFLMRRPKNAGSVAVH